LAPESQSAKPGTLRWPDDPYIGLTSYKVSDRLLFAARQNDVDLFVSQMTGASIRIMLLHGETGCGKTSFLNAGVMPDLEERIGSFHVVRDPNRDYRYALLVRSTHDPLGMLAYEVFQMVRADKHVTGRREHEYHSQLLEGYGSDLDFRQAVDRDPGILVQVLAEISENDPRSIVIGVDQAEEIFSLKPGKEGDAARRGFFHFLVRCTKTESSMKLLIAFRTEFHGRFYSAVRQARGGTADVQRIGDFYLRQLSEDDLVEVIERPASDRESIPGYGSPRDHYKFRYENGVARTIVKELAGEPIPLPALQIVCRRLYLQAEAEPKVDNLAVIRLRAFRLNGVLGQIDGHLQQALDQTLGVYNLRESGRWRDVLWTLARDQPGGGVTTKVIEETVLRATAEKYSVGEKFDDTLMALSKEPWQILKQVNVQKRESLEVLSCYSLGHDVIGYALRGWDHLRSKHRKVLWLFRGAFGVLALGQAYRLLLPPFDTGMGLASWGVPLAIATIACIPNMRYTRGLYDAVYGNILDVLGIFALLQIRVAMPLPAVRAQPPRTQDRR
jgi:hypothetical protein